MVERFVQVGQSGHLVNVATDGETYGHHFKFGDLCLAHALEIEAKRTSFWITNYGEYLDHHPAEVEVDLHLGTNGEGSSWSCAHGVGRWLRDCGCHTGGEAGWNQGWRGPLRDALNYLRDDAAEKFQEAGSVLLKDPWAARNDYIKVLLDPDKGSEFFTKHAQSDLSANERELTLALLEIQRNALLMFTSCAWFFSDLAGIETIQIMRYAARLIELQNALGFESPRARFIEMMTEAKSNDTEKGNGADIFLRYAERAGDTNSESVVVQ